VVAIRMEVGFRNAEGFVMRAPFFVATIALLVLQTVYPAAGAKAEIASIHDPSIWTPLVQGLNQVGLPPGGLNGTIQTLTDDWVPIVSGDEDSMPQFALIAAARTYGEGRIIAFGHDGWLRIVGHGAPFDTNALGVNIIHWLDILGTKRVLGLMATNSVWHSFFVDDASIAGIMRNEGYAFELLRRDISDDRLTDTKLQGVSVLVLTSSFDFFDQNYLAFNSDEIEVIERFVKNGGGLALLGLGWSWAQYRKDPNLGTFPLKPVGDFFGVEWQTYIVADPTNNQINPNNQQYDTWYPYFHKFYPDIPGTPEPVTEPSVMAILLLSSLTMSTTVVRRRIARSRIGSFG